MFVPSTAAPGMNAPMSAPAAEVYPIPRLPVPRSEPPPRVACGQSEDAHDPLPAPAPIWAPASRTTVVARVSMPSPGELGVTSATDWTVALSRLEAMGLGAFQLQGA